MQALHARRGSITSEHSRGFLREFGRRAIARRWEKWPHTMMQRGPIYKGKQESCKLEEGGGYEPSPHPAPRRLPILPWTARAERR